VVFNLMMEWLAIAIDAPMLVIGVLFYLLLWIKHHKRFSTESFIYRIGNMGTGFYKRFMSLFHSKKGVFLAISGMLVLHLLTDVGNFMVPYSLGIYDSLYFDQLGPGHEPVFSLTGIMRAGPDSLFGEDIAQVVNSVDAMGVIFVYLFNFIAMLLLLITPAALWYIIFTRTKFSIPRLLPVLYFSSFACFLLSPVFVMKRVEIGALVGVDIITKDLLQATRLSINAVLVISLLIGVVVFLLSLNSWLRRRIVYGAVIFSLIFFAYYIYLFFIDVSSYYLQVVLENLGGSEFFIGAYFFIFLMLTILFYIGGFVIFIYELVEN